MFDILDKPVDFTVTEYRELVRKTVQEIWQRGNVPIVVGGSGFYINSLFFPPEAETISDTKVSEDKKTAQELWDELNTIDP